MEGRQEKEQGGDARNEAFSMQARDWHYTSFFCPYFTKITGHGKIMLMEYQTSYADATCLIFYTDDASFSAELDTHPSPRTSRTSTHQYGVMEGPSKSK